MNFKSFVLMLLFVIPFHGLFAQKIENFKYKVNGNQIDFTYDLIASEGEGIYEISLYASSNNKEFKLKRAIGQVGKNIAAGRGKSISWSNEFELESFAVNSLTFSLRTGIIKTPLIVERPRDVTFYQRGATYSIEWSGGNERDMVSIELFKGKQNLGEIIRSANTGFYKWSIPSGQKTGSGYRLELTNLTEKSKSVPSGNFTIKSKLPFWAKVIPAAIITGVAAAILLKGDDPLRPLPAPELPGG